MTLDLAKDFRYDTQDHEQQNKKKKKTSSKLKTFVLQRTPARK